MATETEQARLLRAFTQISETFGVARKGIIVTTTGTRVGTWNWTKSAILINPQDDTFKGLVRRFSKNGVFVRQPAKDDLDAPIDDEFPGDNSVLVSKALSRLTPGELDHALKREGYFLVDLDVPVGE